MNPDHQPVDISGVRIGSGCQLVLIAGPCVIESREHTLRLAEAIRGIAEGARVPLIFKASYDKANRSSLGSFRGPGLEAGLQILQEVREATGLPVTADVHEPSQAAVAGKVLDLLQVPAFLCRQTDLLVACARTDRPVNIKKGQFISPDEMQLAVEKVRETRRDSGGGSKAEPTRGSVLLTERGTFFGYGRLVTDMTAIPRMAALAPVVMDATHACQLPGQGGTQSGGQRDMVPILARAGTAAGAHALFIEVHDDPPRAKSDAATVWPLDRLAELLSECVKVHEALVGEWKH